MALDKWISNGKKGKKTDEKDNIIQIINRIKKYLRYLIGNADKSVDNKFSTYIPFFEIFKLFYMIIYII